MWFKFEFWPPIKSSIPTRSTPTNQIANKSHPKNYLPWGQLVQIQFYVSAKWKWFYSAENAQFRFPELISISPKNLCFIAPSGVISKIIEYLPWQKKWKLSKNFKNCNINDVARDLFGNFGRFLPNLSSHFISNMSFIITRQIISPHNL